MLKKNKVLYKVMNKDIYTLYKKPNKFWENVDSLSNCCFSGCNALEVLNIPDSITNIGKYCFTNNSGIKKVKFNDFIKSIPHSCFYNCHNLSIVNNTNNIEVISQSSFFNCSSLTKIHLEKITNIGQYAFYGCQHLTNVYLGSRITKIAKGAFKNCTNLKSIIPYEKTDVIEESNCIEFPENLSTIGDFAFCKCENIEYVKFPNNIKRIGAYAFEKCDNLKGIYLPNSTKSIGIGAFDNKSIRFVNKLNNGDVILSYEKLTNKEVALTVKYKDIGDNLCKFVHANTVDLVNDYKHLKISKRNN